MTTHNQSLKLEQTQMKTGEAASNVKLKQENGEIK